ncbi:response regulator [Nocardia testacea]|uniref:response regulator n=1 Tax=Nocardia testacea TaxID=248551 RepID=UPI003C2C0164
MTRVLIADDEPLIRAGVRAILTTDPQINVVAEAADGREAVDAVRRHRPDIAVLDIQMPGLDGITAAGQIRQIAPATGLIILTTFGEDDYILQALNGGVAGFLTKSGDPGELIAGVHAVAAGAAYLSPKVAARVVAHLANSGPQSVTDSRASARTRVEALTVRERQVLALLGAGLTNGQIARRLTVVEGTIKAHVSSILATLGVDNRAAAAVVAYEAGVAASDTASRNRLG